MTTTTSRADPLLRVKDKEGMQKTYLVLSPEELAKGFVRSVRTSYIHTPCGVVTRMNQTIAETYARDPKFYEAAYCVGCREHFPVHEFTWDKDGTELGS